MKRKVVIQVPDWNATMIRELLAVQADTTDVGPNAYMIRRSETHSLMKKAAAWLR